MKRIRYIAIAVMAFCLNACTEDSIDSLSGEYSDITICNYKDATVQATDKLRRGVKALNVSFTDTNNNAATLRLGSKEWTLGEATFMPVAEVALANEYSGTINGAAITAGNLDVSILNDIYFINGLVSTADSRQYKLYYKGGLTFAIGEEDPEASGYTFTISTSEVSVFNWTTFQNTPYPDVTKYTMNVTDPEGKLACTLDLIHDNHLGVPSLAGTYSIVSDAHERLQIVAGYSLPDYGMAGGSGYMDTGGTMQYLSGGTVEITTAEDAEGNTLYSLKGSGLETINAAGEKQTAGSFSIDYATYSSVSGSVCRDLTIQSAILGREMKYSVYLPEGYDGKSTIPVAYMLHGMGEDQNAWLDSGNLAALTSDAISSGKTGKMAVVMPDGMKTFYCNGVEDGLLYEDFFFNELIPTVEALFNVGKERSKRAIGGLSMGGFGTLYYTIQHRDMFCCSYAMSPVTYMEGCPDLFSLVYTVPAADYPDLTIEVGTEDQLVYELAAYMNMAILMYNLPDYQYIERSGSHDWAFWKGCYPKFMEKLGKYFK